MADPHFVELTATRHLTGSTVVSARGAVTLSTAGDLRTRLVKRLAEGAPVLLDVADLRMDWGPAPEVLVSAVAAAGGWPLARLVLFGADQRTADHLRALRVTESVPLARTVDDAAGLVDVRPARLMWGVDLAADEVAVARASDAVHDVCERWGLPARNDLATIVTELVTNAVEHSGTPFHLRLVLDRSGLRVSVRDRSPGPLPDTVGTGFPDGGGLGAVGRLSRTWGVLHHRDGKAVWAQLPPNERRAATRPREAPRLLPAPPAETAATAVTAPRRRRFVTADLEHAHAFLRTVYGQHTLRLSAADGLPGSHLEYDGVTTNRFAVEHITYDGAVEGLFPPADALVVVQPLEGDFRITSPRDELHAMPGDVVLCGPGTDILIGSARLHVEVVRLAPPAVARVVAELTGFDAPSVPFALSRPVSPARAAHWRAAVEHLRRDVLDNDEVMSSPLARAMVLRNLVAMLVETFPNPARDALGGPAAERGRVLPWTVRRAVEFIEEHAGDDIGLADIAAAAGIGVRGLQMAFRRHVDVTPLEHLRRVRLERAHRDLQAASRAEATVGAIADRWGFPHHGNFSALYLRTYGRSPSMTLRS